MNRSRKPGEAFQFDWSEDWADLAGERVKRQVAHTKLSHSRAFVVRAYPLPSHEMLFDAHYHAFRVLNGIPGRGAIGAGITCLHLVYDVSSFPAVDLHAASSAASICAVW